MFRSVPLIFIFVCVDVYAQDATARQSSLIERIEREFRSYNAQDWTALRDGYADTLKVCSLPDCCTPVYTSAVQLIDRFKSNFKKFPENHAEVLSVIVSSNKAVIKEKITGRGEPIFVVVVFEIQNDQIVRIWNVP